MADAKQTRGRNGARSSGGSDGNASRSSSGRSSGSSGRSSGSSGRSSGSSGRSSRGSDGGSSGSQSQLSARDVVERVRDELPALLGRPIESVLGVQHDEEEGWEVTVQVVELARIPHTTDVLGSYVVTLDDGGELVGYQRRRRFNRGQPDED